MGIVRKDARLISTASPDKLAKDRAGHIELTEDELDRVAGGMQGTKKDVQPSAPAPEGSVPDGGKKKDTIAGGDVSEQEAKLAPTGSTKK